MQETNVDRLSERVLEKITPLIGPLVMDRIVNEKKPLETPKLKNPGCVKQAEVLVRAINHILPILDHPDANVSTRCKAAHDVLLKRVEDIRLADNHPDGFAIVDKMDLLRSFSSGNGDASAAVLALTALESSSSRNTRKRPATDYPFPAGGVGYRQFNQKVPRDQNNFTRPHGNYGGDRPRFGSHRSTNSGSCFLCHQHGHWARDCPSKSSH